MHKKGFCGMYLGTGEIVLASTGRKTTPFPKVDGGTWRKLTNTIYRKNMWLLENCILEAKARNDDFNLVWIEKVKISKGLHKNDDCDLDDLESYLFDKEWITSNYPPYKWSNK